MKFLNVVLILCIALTALGIANAQTATSAYSVTEVQAATATDLEVTSYTATVSTSFKDKNFTYKNGDAITITTSGCTHTPVKGGENAIVIVDGNTNSRLMFSQGGTCKVAGIALTSAPAKQPKTKNGHTNPFVK
jgi:hypothetical protein